MTINYNLSIPNPPNSPSQDVPLMQQNTNAIDQLIAVDHVTFGDTANPNGYHTDIHMVTQLSDPSTVSGIGQLYTKVANSDTQLFFKSGGNKVSQLTGSSSLENGYQWIGQTLIQWGKQILTGGSSQNGTITFPISFPNTSLNISLSLVCSNTTSSSDNTIAVVTGTPSNTIFRWRYNGNGSTSYPAFYWFAIGN